LFLSLSLFSLFHFSLHIWDSLFISGILFLYLCFSSLSFSLHLRSLLSFSIPLSLLSLSVSFPLSFSLFFYCGSFSLSVSLFFSSRRGIWMHVLNFGFEVDKLSSLDSPSWSSRRRRFLQTSNFDLFCRRSRNQIFEGENGFFFLYFLSGFI